MGFKVATFNVNSVRSRLPILKSWLNQERPDVLCLQETKVEDKDFPAAAFEELGYHVTFFGQKRWNGVAIVSREPPEEVGCGLDAGGPPEEARLIRGVYSGITILNAYVPQGRDVSDAQFAYKLAWLEKLGNLLAESYTPDQSLLWCGDLNHALEPEDVHDPERLRGHVCFHPEVDLVFRKILDWGLVDIFRQHCSEPGQFSFYDYRVPNAVKRRIGWRIDHIMVTLPLAEKATGCAIDMEPRLQPKPSDHTPVVAEFVLD